MIRVGITGQSGFIGSHLFNYLNIRNEEFSLVPFEDAFFGDFSRLSAFVSSCDCIVHLAAMNRHKDPQVIYDTNLHLVRELIRAMEESQCQPHVLFSSSTQEDLDNLYGRSKSEGRKLLEQWAERNGARFSGFIIPNIFGPFGQPFYNSVVATFCYQLTHNETPRVDVDATLKLLYVQELSQLIAAEIKDSGQDKIRRIRVPHSAECKVSELLSTLQGFRSEYQEKGVFPDLRDPFVRNLFNTYVCFLDHESYFPFKLKLNTDNRGSFVETVKLNGGGQVSFSTTMPGVTRGNHYHTRKAERFAVIKGEALIQLRRIGTDKVMNFYLSGKEPSYVDMPVWYTHNIKNTGSDELYTVFWISEFFDPGDQDTFFEAV